MAKRRLLRERLSMVFAGLLVTAMVVTFYRILVSCHGPPLELRIVAVTVRHMWATVCSASRLEWRARSPLLTDG